MIIQTQNKDYKHGVLSRPSSGFPPRQPGSRHVGLVVEEAALRQIFSEYFGFPCQAFHRLLHTHHHNHHLGLAQQANSGLGSNPPSRKKKHIFRSLTYCCNNVDLTELHNLYSSPSIIRISKSRRMRLAGHVARMGEKRNAYRLLVGKPEGKNH
jgi:hypothetical protein